MAAGYGAPESSGMGFATLQSWRAVKAHKGLFLGWCMSVLVLGAFGVAMLPARYQAGATVEIAAQAADPLAPAGQEQSDQFQDDDLPSTVAAMMQSRDVAQAVLAQLPPPPPQPSRLTHLLCTAAPQMLCTAPPADPQVRQQAAIDAFLQDLSVTPEPHSRILDVDVTSDSATRAQALANAVVRAYQQASITQQQAQGDHVAGWLQARTQQLQQHWLAAAQAADQYRVSHNIPETSAGGVTTPLIDQQLADAAASLDAAQAQLIDAQTQHGQAIAAAPSPMAIADGEMLVQLETARDQLAGEFGPNYPKVNALTQQIEALRSHVGSTTGGAGGAVLSVAGAQARVDRLTARLRSLSQGSAAQEALLAQVQILQAEADNAHAAYSTFVEHAAEVADRTTLLQPAVTMVSEAGLPLRPSFPDRPKLMLGVLLLTLVAGAAAALARQTLAPAMTGEAELADEVPLLAALPFVPARKGRQIARHIFDEPQSRVAQDMRNIAQSLALLSSSGAGRAVLITSAGAAEGRSIFAAWLAAVIWQHGKSVLLIETSQQTRLALHDPAPMRRGFNDMLFNAATAEEVVQQDPATGIDLISGGSIANQALERGDISRLQAILSELKSRYDVVILDSAPLLAAPDGFMLSTAADEAIFICRWQQNSPKAVTAAIDRLRAQGVQVAGIVISMMQKNQRLAADGQRSREMALAGRL